MDLFLMAAASIEVSVQPPDLAAAVCLFGAVVAIDLAALRWRRATISKWCRHTIRRHPAAAATVAAALGIHLVLDIKADPLRGFASWLDRWIR